MKIDKNSFVSLEYQLRIGKDEVYPAPNDYEEISLYLGGGGMPPGLEAALLGMEADEHKVVNLKPSEAFGEVDEKMIIEVSRAEFDPAVELRPGLIFDATDKKGQTSKFYIRELRPETVVIDFNHPLAGKELEISVTVREVREATPEDIERLHTRHGWKGNRP